MARVMARTQVFKMSVRLLCKSNASITHYYTAGRPTSSLARVVLLYQLFQAKTVSYQARSLVSKWGGSFQTDSDLNKHSLV